MRLAKTGTKACLLGSALLFSSPVLVCAAEAQHSNLQNRASSNHVHQASARISPSHHAHAYHTSAYHAVSHHGGVRYAALEPGARHGHGVHHVAYQSYGISCVPYARQVSGIQVAGNAWQWWNNAAGAYARGDRPEPGSVLNFRANSRMPLGHVAVVAEIVNSREIIINQANWPSAGLRGGVSRNVAVVDVSEANNWSAVRVELGHRGEFGSVYPTYGFIYNRPDTGMVSASVNRPAPQPAINPVPSDLRPAAERPWHTFEEVAESPSGPRQRLNLQVVSVADRVGR
jgi:surface antigen